MQISETIAGAHSDDFVKFSVKLLYMYDCVYLIQYQVKICLDNNTRTCILGRISV